MKTFYDSPIGRLVITGNGIQISRIELSDKSVRFVGQAPAYLRQCVQELKEFFHEGREHFSVALDLG